MVECMSSINETEDLSQESGPDTIDKFIFSRPKICDHYRFEVSRSVT